jgi:predicted nicotinamide N-methyase
MTLPKRQMCVHRVTCGHWPIELLAPASPDELLNEPAVLQRFEQDEYMPYWAHVWPAACMLAEFILAEDPAPEGGRALEIGSGLGLVAIAAAKAGWQVTCSDYDADALDFAQHNAGRNGVTLAGFEVLDWRRPILGQRRFDRLLAADVLYEVRNHSPIVELIAASLAPGGAAMICDPDRQVARGFVGLLADSGMTYERIPVSTDQVNNRTVSGMIYRIKALA